MSIKVANMKKARYFTENWALVEEDGKVYMAEFILRNDFARCSFEFRQISNRYDEIGDFDKNGIAIVMLDDLYGLINERGEEICKPQYDNIEVIFSKYYCAEFYEGDSRIIDVNGNIKFVCQNVYDHDKRQCAIVEFDDGAYGIIDIECREIHRRRYDDVYFLGDNLFEATIGDILIIVNYKGEEVFEVKDGSVTKGDDGYFDIWVGDKCGKLSPEGKLIIPIEYDSISELDDGAFTAVIKSIIAVERVQLFDTKGRKVGKEYRMNHRSY